jgi:hypothetical protein
MNELLKELKNKTIKVYIEEEKGNKLLLGEFIVDNRITKFLKMNENTEIKISIELVNK